MVKAGHECTRELSGSVPMSISNFKCHTQIRAGFSHWVIQICKSKTHGFLSTCGSTGTWKYLQVLSILNINKLVNCKHQYVEQNTFKTLCHTVTEPDMAQSATRFLPSIRSLPLTPTPIPQKHCKLYLYIPKTNQMFLSRLIMHITR